METTTVLLLDRFKALKGFGSDNQVAVDLGLSRATVSGWRHGKSHAEPVTVEKLAVFLGLDVLSVLAAVEADRAKNEQTRRLWSRYGKGAFMALAMGLSTLGTVAIANPNPGNLGEDGTSHYAKSRRYRKSRSMAATMQVREPEQRSSGGRLADRLTIRAKGQRRGPRKRRERRFAGRPFCRYRTRA